MPRGSHKRANGFGSVYLHKNGIYYISYTLPNGKRKRESAKTRVKYEAERLLQERIKVNLMRDERSKLEMIKAQIATVENQIETEENEQRKIRLEDALDVYFKRGYSLNIVASTRAKYEKTYRLLLEHFKGKVAYLGEIRKDDALEFLGAIRDRYCPESYNVHLGFIKLLFKKLGFPKVFDECEFLDVPESTRTEFSVEEVRKIEAYLKEYRGEQFLLFWKLLCCTGQRKADVANLKWNEIDLASKTITLMPRKTIRKKKIVTIPIFKELLDLLAGFNHYDDVYVLPDIKHRYDHRTLKSAMKVVYDRCGIQTNFRDERGRWHSLKCTHSTRHFFISLCANHGIPLDVVKAMTGHSDEVIKKYFHPNAEICRSKMEQIEFFGSSGIAEDMEVKIPRTLYEKVIVDQSKTFAENLSLVLNNSSIVSHMGIPQSVTWK